MLTELEQNLNEIYNDIKVKLVPENIKKGVTILGITGTAESEVSENE